MSEARKLNIPVIAILDTNCDPDEVAYKIPGNDRAIRSAALLTRVIADSVAEGLVARAANAANAGREDAPVEAGAELATDEPLAEWESELLAPAGGPESAYAAFHFGADAVYLGLKKFSARAEAENFTLDELDEVTAYAHSLDPPRRVFVTVNTLIRQEHARFETSQIRDFVPLLVEKRARRELKHKPSISPMPGPICVE